MLSYNIARSALIGDMISAFAAVRANPVERPIADVARNVVLTSGPLTSDGRLPPAAVGHSADRSRFLHASSLPLLLSTGRKVEAQTTRALGALPQTQVLGAYVSYRLDGDSVSDRLTDA